MYNKCEKMAGKAAMDRVKNLDVLDVCPQLILQDRTKRFYDGYITVCVSSMSKNTWVLLKFSLSENVFHYFAEEEFPNIYPNS